MAYVTRVNGDATGVVNVDLGDHSLTSNGVIISTGIGKHPTAYKITGDSFTSPGQYSAGGAVETILRTVEVAATVLAYQVDTTQISLLVEGSGWASNANVQTAITSIGNRLVDATIPVTAYNFSNVVVISDNGMKFV